MHGCIGYPRDPKLSFLQNLCVLIRTAAFFLTLALQSESGLGEATVRNEPPSNTSRTALLTYVELLFP